MAFAHILRDKPENIVTINLTEIKNLNKTFFSNGQRDKGRDCFPSQRTLRVL